MAIFKYVKHVIFFDTTNNYIFLKFLIIFLVKYIYTCRHASQPPPTPHAQELTPTHIACAHML